MESLLTFLLSLLFLPAIGATALGLTAAIWQTATDPGTPKWQQYLWFLGTGFVLLHLQEFAQAFASGADQW